MYPRRSRFGSIATSALWRARWTSKPARRRYTSTRPRATRGNGARDWPPPVAPHAQKMVRPHCAGLCEPPREHFGWRRQAVDAGIQLALHADFAVIAPRTRCACARALYVVGTCVCVRVCVFVRVCVCACVCVCASSSAWSSVLIFERLRGKVCVRARACCCCERSALQWHSAATGWDCRATGCVASQRGSGCKRWRSTSTRLSVRSAQVHHSERSDALHTLPCNTQHAKDSITYGGCNIAAYIVAAAHVAIATDLSDDATPTLLIVSRRHAPSACSVGIARHGVAVGRTRETMRTVCVGACRASRERARPVQFMFSRKA
jgi:hypothetical protein